VNRRPDCHSSSEARARARQTTDRFAVVYGMLPGMSEVTVVIADDHTVVRKGLRLLIEAEPGLRVVAEAGTVPDALRMARAHRPNVLVLDLNMPGGSSLEAIPTMREEAPMTAIVVLTMQNDPSFARQALQSGALGFVLKEAADDELLGAIRLAAEGETYLNPRLGARLAAQPSEPAGPPDDLSERELEVLKLIALGHTNSEIASQLYLSVRTVESHRAHIQQKTRRSSRAELVRYALEHGLVDVQA
jgi:two-component system response regulator NreC